MHARAAAVGAGMVLDLAPTRGPVRHRRAGVTVRYGR